MKIYETVKFSDKDPLGGEYRSIMDLSMELARSTMIGLLDHQKRYTSGKSREWPTVVANTLIQSILILCNLAPDGKEVETLQGMVESLSSILAEIEKKKHLQ